MSRHEWRYHDDLAVLYLKLKFGPDVDPGHPAVKHLAERIGTAAASVCLRKSNFDFLQTGAGASNVAGQTQEVWHAYEENPDEMAEEAKLAFQDLAGMEAYEPSEPIYASQVGERCRCGKCGGSVYSTCREDCDQCLLDCHAKACRCGDCGHDELDDEEW